MKLETTPKASFHRNYEEVEFLESFFGKVALWSSVDESLIEDAIRLGERYDIVNLDALHAAAAIRAGADRFVTTERPGRPLHRLNEIRIVHLLDLKL